MTKNSSLKYLPSVLDIMYINKFGINPFVLSITISIKITRLNGNIYILTQHIQIYVCWLVGKYFNDEYFVIF